VIAGVRGRSAILVALVCAACTERTMVLGPDDGGNTDARRQFDAGLVLTGENDVASGGQHSCAVLGGLLACWGNGTDGALGSGARGERYSPVIASIDYDWTAVSAGDTFACGIRRGGLVWCWGSNNEGQLGVGDVTSRFEPTAVALGGVAEILVSSRVHSCAIVSDGRLLCWGADAEGQLGRGGSYPGPPALTPVTPSTELLFRDVSVGQGHTCAITVDGQLWCWGRNTDDQLGLGPEAGGQLRVPQRVGTGVEWRMVASGQAHTCALQNDGSLWCWGDNHHGQLGLVLDAVYDVPTRVGTDLWASLSTAIFQTCGTRSDGSLWCWGRNAEGQLGVGDNVDRSEPTRVGNESSWARVSCGWFHTCAQREDGSVACTGENTDGRLGVGDPIRRNELTDVLDVVIE
jgi:alpha-tubulin suppressor-like RCC1 family protein